MCALQLLIIVTDLLLNPPRPNNPPCLEVCERIDKSCPLTLEAVQHEPATFWLQDRQSNVKRAGPSLATAEYLLGVLITCATTVDTGLAWTRPHWLLTVMMLWGEKNTRQ